MEMEMTIWGRGDPTVGYDHTFDVKQASYFFFPSFFSFTVQAFSQTDNVHFSKDLTVHMRIFQMLIENRERETWFFNAIHIRPKNSYSCR